MKPEVGQRVEDDSEVSSAVGREKASHVFNQNPSAMSHTFICDPRELKEESGSVARESGAVASDGEVLTGEASAEEFN